MDADPQSEPDMGLLWTAEVVSNDKIMERFQIDWNAPIGIGRYGKVYEV
jgi:hypothetical protein